MSEDTGGHLRRNGTAVVMAAAILTTVGAAGAPAATAPSLTAAQRADVGSAVSSKTRGGARARLAGGLAALSTRAVRTAPRAEQARRLGLPATGPGSLLRDGSDVVVNVRAQTTSPGQVEALRDSGARVIDVSAELRTVTVAVAAEALDALAAVPGVEVVMPELRPLTSGLGSDGVTAAAPPCGDVTSEGDQQLRAAQARDLFGVDGTGVKVGVISDSYDVDVLDTRSAAQDVASGDLPGGARCGHLTPVQVLTEGSGNDEGRAMLQVVHDLAPGATLAFNAAGASAQFPSRVTALRNAGARVIVDDISYLEEPFFQDGPHAVAANTVSAAGSAYYSSAANSNVIVGSADRGSWEAPSYRPQNCGAPAPYIDCMNFGTAANPTIFQQFRVDPGGSLVLDLQWAQPWFGVTTDLDAFLLDENGTQVAQGTSPNTGGGTQKPLEVFGVDNNEAVSHTYRLAILKFSGAADPRLKWTLIGSRRVTPVPALAPGDISGPTIFGHNGAPGTMGVAAVPFNNSATIEPFSSRGPVTHYFGPVSGTTPAAPLGAPQVLAKPDLAATDGAQTTFFAGAGPPFRFFGTSEAAPHAAAVAALQFNAQPGASVASVEAAQKGTAAPVGSFGAVAQGAGLVDAARAVGAMVDTFVPNATTGAASGMTSSTATLGGVVNPRRAATSYQFEHGTTTAYGATTPRTDVGSGTADVAASAPLTGLAPATTYHFRLVATNALGSTTGADGVFTTPAVGGGTTPPPPAGTIVTPQPPAQPAPKPKVRFKLRGRTLTLTFSGGTFRTASVTIKKGKRSVAKASGRVRNNKLTVRLKRRLKKGRYALTIVLTDTQNKKSTLRTPLRV